MNSKKLRCPIYQLYESLQFQSRAVSTAQRFPVRVPISGQKYKIAPAAHPERRGIASYRVMDLTIVDSISSYYDCFAKYETSKLQYAALARRNRRLALFSTL